MYRTVEVLDLYIKSKEPEFKGQMLASEKSRGTDKTLTRHITEGFYDSALSKLVNALSKIVNALKMQL